MPLDLDAIRRGELRREDADVLVRYAYSTVCRNVGLGNVQGIEEVLQDALLEFVRFCQRPFTELADDRSVLGLFRRIARYKAAGWVRAAVRRRPEPLDGMTEGNLPSPPPFDADGAEDDGVAGRGAEHDDNPAFTAWAEAVRQRLRLPFEAPFEMLMNTLIQGAGLEGVEPALLQMHAVEELTERECAQRLGLRPGGMNFRVHRMMGKIRRFLGLGPWPGGGWRWGPDRDL